jgi:hypothetical protein
MATIGCTRIRGVWGPFRRLDDPPLSVSDAIAVPPQAANVAKRTGVLELEDHMSVAVLNSHLTYCYARRRPYLAIGKHGRRIVVDLLPVAGLGPSANATR